MKHTTVETPVLKKDSSISGWLNRDGFWWSCPDLARKFHITSHKIQLEFSTRERKESVAVRFYEYGDFLYTFSSKTKPNLYVCTQTRSFLRQHFSLKDYFTFTTSKPRRLWLRVILVEK